MVISTATLLSLFSMLSVLIHLLGVANAAHAVLYVQSSRGAIAWSLSLVTLPWVSIPLYWILGKNKFKGYSEALKRAYREHQDLVRHAYDNILALKAPLPEELATVGRLAEALTVLPFTSHNDIVLLVNGAQTYQNMLAAIASATDYILLQSYILHDDDIGNIFKAALIAKAKEGVRIYLLTDGIGSRKLPRTYLNALRQHGIVVNSFRSTKGLRSRFQVNFRNHRKILIADGKIGLVGGLNIGDEYLGKDPKLGDWRDTHIQVTGPAVQCLQKSFLSDWYWATKDMLEVSWVIETDKRNLHTAFVLTTGPADPVPTCTLFFLELINRAQTRLWIASPYFVPSTSVLNALKLAAIRGVDVRIILPNRPDHYLVYLCSFSYYEELQKTGIQLYRYQPGFMHQKVILCDGETFSIAGVGTVNLDNRSFVLNFEVMTFAIDWTDPQRNSVQNKDHSTFIQNVEKMLLDDFKVSRLIDLSSYQKKSFGFKLAARVSRLLAPVL